MSPASAKKYPLSKEETSLYLACTLNPERKNAYILGWCLELPAQTGTKARLEQATKALFTKHRILCARLGQDENGAFYKYDCGENPLIEYETRSEGEPLRDDADYCTGIDIAGGRLYRVVIAETPSTLKYYLIVHHIVMDGTGRQNLIRDLEAAFRGDDIGGADLAPYEFALREQALEQTEAFAADRAYFTALLADAEGQAPDPDTHGEAEGFAHYSRWFDGVDAGAVKRKKAACGVRTSTIFSGAVGYALALFTGARQAALGTAMSGRTPENRDSCGMFVRTLPLLCGIAPDRSVDDYLRDLDAQTTRARAHSLYAYLDMSTECGLTLPVCFAYQGDMDDGHMIFDGAERRARVLRADDSDYEIRFYLWRKDGRYLFEAVYRSDHYSPALIESMACTVEQVLSELLRKENMAEIQPVARDQLTMMDRWNDTVHDAPMTDIVSMFRAAAAGYPDNTAVIFKDRALSYRRVDDISERIGGFLRGQGIGKGDVVSILIPRCEWMVIASLGVLKAGAAYAPLDPSYPPERLAFMLRDAGSRLLIADETLLDRVREYNGPVLLTRDIDTLPAVPASGAHPAPEDLFILLYTSGSMGTPKGVMLEHRNLANFCHWYRDYFHLDENSRVAAYASFGFDANMMDQYPALSTGACVCIVEEEIRLDLAAMEERFNRVGITHAFMTTQVGRQFYGMARPEKLRWLILGGEKMLPMPPRADGPALINGYGPTECCIFASVMPVDRMYARVPIGRPIYNHKCYVVDACLRRLPPLAPGELLISGRGVGRGYLNRPELTEKAFVRNPFSDDADYARAYRTGDVVRLLSDGNIDFIGRNDGQVKVRGFRIELAEVEGAIRAFPGIRDATVQAFDEESGGGEYIAAYVVSDEAVDISALNDFIRRQKPSYMVPAATMQIDAIPLNQNQKVNRRALPRPMRARAENVAPRNQTEQKLCELFAEIVGHHDFGVTTNLEEAGLSSIGAIRLNLMLAKAFDMVFTARDLKEQDTLEKLGAFIAAGQAHGDVFPVQVDYPLSKTQEGVYVESIARPDSTIYNIPLLLEIDPSLDMARLKKAIVAAINAHPFVKTRIFLNDDGDVRMRRMDGDFSFDEAAIEDIAIPSIDAVRDGLVKPFKLIGGKLFRIRLLHSGGGKRYLFAEFHHLIFDGTSFRVLLEDISLAYRGQALEAEVFSGYEVVLNEQRLRTEQRLRETGTYYERLLDEAETQSLPVGDIADGTVPMGPGGSGLYERDGVFADADTVRAFCRDKGLSMNAFFFTAFGHLLNACLNTERVVFAGIYSGRSDSRLARTMGMLVRTIPVVVGAKGSDTIPEQIKTLGAQLLDTQAQDLLSFAELSRRMHVSADVMFAYQGDEFDFDRFCGKRAARIRLELDTAKAPLNLGLSLQGRQIHYHLEYDRGRYSEAFVRAFIDSLDYGVRELLTKEKMADVSFLTEDMRAELELFNDTAVSTGAAFAPERFRSAVRRYADKTAVIADGGRRSVTFAELGRRANQVARALKARGIGRGERVGLYMNRTEDVYAIRQGIMLSGAAFVSLEPEYPDERIRFILSDAGIHTLLTTGALYDRRRALFEGHADVLLLDDIYAAPAGEAVALPALRDDDPAYCIYTSGSTGLPKGVEILHRNLRNLLDYNDKNALAHAYVDHCTVFMALAAITFDVSIIEEMLPLCHGRTVCMATEDEIHNPMLLADTVISTGADMMKCTPSYILSMLEAPGVGELLDRLNALILGAEPCPKGLVQRLREAGFKGILFNSYGPTETCVSVSIGTLSGNYITVGRPNANTRFVIRDRYGNVLPRYMRGELVIAGDCVGRGYVGLPDRTKRAFIELPSAHGPLPAYRSGDVAYFNAHGEIMHCGRNDSQVKIRGLRVELDGVENTMNTYPGIERSVVLALGEGDGRYLAGYYVSRQRVDEAALSRHLRKTLMAYMVPAVYVHLDTLPLTANGKVNRKALPAPEARRKTAKKGKARTALQAEIAAMFAQALGLDDIGPDEDFFEAGGTSMLAFKVTMRAMVKGLPISYQDVFAHPTAADMERHVLERQGRKPEKQAEHREAAAPDSAPIAEILRRNAMKHVDEMEGGPLGDVLLTGATGFLGIHVFRHLIEHSSAQIICLIRRGHWETPEKRLEAMLMYYFDDPFAEAFASGRVRVIDGDITDRAFVLAQREQRFDRVINCAACVKHFASDDILERVNVTGVKHLIALCEQTGSRLVQISTVSVAGENVNHALDGRTMREDMLYFGQDLSNPYAKSKFDAEEAILTEVAAGRLSAKIIRVGNLMGRDSDGKFQANAVTSGFWRKLRGYAAIGAFPVSRLAKPVEFSPIDKVAEAVCALAGTPEQFTVFHALNGHWIEMGDLIAAMNAVGIAIAPVSDAEFQRRISLVMRDEKKNMLVSGLISYLSSDSETVRAYVPEDHTFTKNALYRLGFRWPLTDERYLENSINALRAQGFFDGTDET